MGWNPKFQEHFESQSLGLHDQEAHQEAFCVVIYYDMGRLNLELSTSDSFASLCIGLNDIIELQSVLVLEDFLLLWSLNEELVVIESKAYVTDYKNSARSPK